MCEIHESQVLKASLSLPHELLAWLEAELGTVDETISKLFLRCCSRFIQTEFCAVLL